MPKSPDAFRTISEVAEWLGVQAHVLRFWESKFTQVKPIKRAGGRRYYRPADMQLLGGIKKLLHDDGLTIKGVQKILREEGMSHVAAMSAALDDAEAEAAPAQSKKAAPKPAPEAVVLPFETAREQPDEVKPDQQPDATEPQQETSAEDDADGASIQQTATEDEIDGPEPEFSDAAQPDSETISNQETNLKKTPQEPDPEDKIASEEISVEAVEEPLSTDKDAEIDAATNSEPELEAAESDTGLDADLADAAPVTPEPDTVEASPKDEVDETAKQSMSPLPPFLRSPAPTQDEGAPTDNAPAAAQDVGGVTSVEATADDEHAEPEAVAPADEEPTPARRARDIGMPDVMAEQDIPADTTTLSRVFRARSLDAETAREIAPLLSQLTALRDRMASRRGSGPSKS